MFSQAMDCHAPELPDPSAVEMAVEGLASVLDEQDPVAAATLCQLIHPIRDTVQVCCHHRIQRDPVRVGDGGRVKVPRDGIDRPEHRHQTCGEDREEHHVVGHWGQQQAVSRPEPFSESEVECQTARGHIECLAAETAVEEILDRSYHPVQFSSSLNSRLDWWL